MDDQTPNLASPQSCCLRTECGTGLGPAGALAAGGSFSQAPERRLRAVLLLLGMIWSHWPFPFPGFLQTLFWRCVSIPFFLPIFFLSFPSPSVSFPPFTSLSLIAILRYPLHHVPGCHPRGLSPRRAAISLTPGLVCSGWGSPSATQD